MVKSHEMRSGLDHASLVTDRVIATIEDYQTLAWLAAAGIAVGPATSFDDLEFDTIDQFVLARIVTKRFDVPMPSSMPWPQTVGGLISIVDRMLQREQRLKLVMDFFGRTWRPAAASVHAVSGPALASRLQKMKPQRVLDIGCGYNELKQVVPTLIGIDVANPQADIAIDFLRYERGDEPFDVVLALGSINFGGTEDILAELRHAASMLSGHGRLFMRVNPGIRWSACPELELYGWSRDNIRAHGEAVGLEVDGAIEEEKGQNGPRLAFAYRRRTDSEAVRKPKLHQPASTRAAAGAGQQAMRPADQRREAEASSAVLDFATEKIIWLTFSPAMSGHALARIISASPEMYWDRAAQGIDPLELRSPHDWHPGADAVTCHYLVLPTPSLMKGEHDFAFTWGPTARQAFRAALEGASEDVARHIRRCFAQPLHFVQPTHVPDAEIAAAFPNCRRVALVDETPETFWVRTFHQKLNGTLWQRELQQQIWRGASLSQALADSPVAVPLYHGKPITHLERRLGPDPENGEIRRYYHGLVENDLARAMAGQTSCPDTVVVDRSRLFSTSGWQHEYEAMCRALGITPVIEAVGRFIREYNAAQWRRRPPQRED